MKNVEVIIRIGCYTIFVSAAFNIGWRLELYLCEFEEFIVDFQMSGIWLLLN